MRTFLGLSLASLLLALPATAAARDRDHDGLPDRWERKHHLSTKRASANADPDRDRVDNRNELREGTKPRDRDSDNDSRRDGREDRDRDGLSNAGEDLTGNDPRNRDSDGDGVRDGKEAAGVVTSFVDGVLTIELAGGGSIEALVTDETEIECESEDAVEAGFVQLSRRRGRRSGRRASGRSRRSAGTYFRSAVASTEEEDPEAEDPYEGEEEGEDPGEGEEDEYEEDEEDEEDEDDEGEELEEQGEGDCPANPLTPGARVRDADLYLSEGGFELDYIGLLR